MLPLMSVVEAPGPVVSLAEAKAHLRVESADDDAIIEGFVAAATEDLDGATGWLGRALGEQTLSVMGAHFPGGGVATAWCGELRACTFHPHEMRLPCPPVQRIVSVVYFDPAGAKQTLDPSAYSLISDLTGGRRDARFVVPAPRTFWPATELRPDAVTVTYVAGYADGKLPAAARAAILLKVGALYSTRNDAAAQAETASAALLGPLRVFA